MLQNDWKNAANDFDFDEEQEYNNDVKTEFKELQPFQFFPNSLKVEQSEQEQNCAEPNLIEREEYNGTKEQVLKHENSENSEKEKICVEEEFQKAKEYLDSLESQNSISVQNSTFAKDDNKAVLKKQDTKEEKPQNVRKKEKGKEQNENDEKKKQNFDKATYMRNYKRPESNFLCNSCDFSTKFKHNLENHLLYHDEKNKLKCEKCNYSTFNKHRFKKHEKVGHNKI